MAKVVAKLFRQNRGQLPSDYHCFTFAGDVIAVLVDAYSPILSIVRQATGKGAMQVIVTASVFSFLLNAEAKGRWEVQSLTLPPDADPEDQERLDQILRDGDHGGSGSVQRSWVLDLIFAYPPVKAELIVWMSGGSERLVLLSNGIIHGPNEQSLKVLGHLLEPAIQ